ncbi:hypothetical protein JNJ66_04360 [Candidatus Saccharibacteria bacterium]|nr:hypothetical protein [Candidatus Saccharibacteria bacterium]
MSDTDYPSRRYAGSSCALGTAGMQVRPAHARPAVHTPTREQMAAALRLAASPGVWGETPDDVVLECCDWKVTGGVAGGPLSAALQLSVLGGGNLLDNLSTVIAQPDCVATLHRDCLAVQTWLLAAQRLASSGSPLYDLYNWLHRDEAVRGNWLSDTHRLRIASWARSLTRELLAAGLDDEDPAQRPAGVPFLDTATRRDSEGAGMLVYNRTGQRFQGAVSVNGLAGGYPVVIDADALRRSAVMLVSQPDRQRLATAAAQLFNLAYATGWLLQPLSGVVCVWSEPVTS